MAPVTALVTIFVLVFQPALLMGGEPSQAHQQREFLVTVRDAWRFREAARRIVEGAGGTVDIRREYHIGDWHAALVEVVGDNGVIGAIRKDPSVLDVEDNLWVRLHQDRERGLKEGEKGDPNLRMYIVQVKGGSAEVKKIRDEVKTVLVSSGAHVEIIKEVHVYSWHGMVVRMDKKAADILASFPNVMLVEKNEKVHMAVETTVSARQLCQQQESGESLWGLSRINSHEMPDYVHALYEYSEYDSGHDVDIYVVDSGVFVEHEEFEGRAIWGMTASGVRHEEDTDLEGHGTHVASTAAGKTYGVAKQATIIAVKVVGKEGNGYLSDVIEGIEWSVNRIKDKKKEGRSVVNLSLGGDFISPSLEGAVQSAIETGVSFSISAGNDDVDACRITPARVSAAITVSASNKNDRLASFSNYGPCVDIIAPGVGIFGASIGDTTASTLKSGTSMSAPHVSGAIARYLSSQPQDVQPSPAEVRQHIIDSASEFGNIEYFELPHWSTPNRLLYVPCRSAGVTQSPEDDESSSMQCHTQHTQRDLWSLTRISSRESPADYDDGQYLYSEDDMGKEVDIYVLDTGVNVDHSDFEGRAVHGFTVSGLAGEGDEDLHGHGTHVASLAAGRDHGTAKAANVISVKVLGRMGVGDATGLLEGLEWVAQEVYRRNSQGSVVNLSLGFALPMYSLDAVIQVMVQAGLTFVVAAGNDQREACRESPARISSVITVAATDINDHLASFSNYGSCVDVLAPGQDIKGASHLGRHRTTTMSGTSMSAPYVAGVVARHLSSTETGVNLTPEQNKAYVVDTGTYGIVAMDDDDVQATPNILLYAGCDEDSYTVEPFSEASATACVNQALLWIPTTLAISQARG